MKMLAISFALALTVTAGLLGVLSAAKADSYAGYPAARDSMVGMFPN